MNSAHNQFSPSPDRARTKASAFTLIELLVVIAIIAILAALLLPALTTAQQKAQGIQCMNNHRQLALAWRMYAEDNHDLLVYASDYPGNWQINSQVLDQYAWTLTHMDFDPNNQGNWDINYDMVKRPLWPYTSKNPAIYKCPSDKSFLIVDGEQKPRVRSMSMNLYVGGFDGTDGGWPWAHPYRVYTKLTEIDVPTKIFVFLDMREDSVNWGNFMTCMEGYSPSDPSQYCFDGDYPGMYHHLACGFSFADGHSELKRWRDARTMPPLTAGANPLFDVFSQSPDNPDVAWLQDHSTRPR
jgi:prepilin-type N-terminal cleavage/methylation domain-containing protein